MGTVPVMTVAVDRGTWSGVPLALAVYRVMHTHLAFVQGFGEGKDFECGSWFQLSHIGRVIAEFALTAS